MNLAYFPKMHPHTKNTVARSRDSKVRARTAKMDRDKHIDTYTHTHRLKILP